MNQNRSMVVSIIGRPNVGKSSLFNRLLKRQNKALTHNEPGVTRDRHYGLLNIADSADIDAQEMILVDTGGFYPETQNMDQETVKDKFFDLMRDHAHMAMDESDLILFVVDVREGLLPFDESIARTLREKKKDFWLIINKFDSDKQWGEEADFYSLGLEEDQIHFISAAHGRGVEDLREDLQKHGSQVEKSNQSKLQNAVSPREDVVARVAIIGAPNAGKSTLLNQLTRENRALVSDIAGTTVDPIEGFFDLYFGHDIGRLKAEGVTNRRDSVLIEEYQTYRRNHPEVFQEQQVLDQSETWASIEAEEVEVNEKNMERLQEQVFGDEADASEAPEGQSYWRSIHLIDTAGIRKQKNVTGHIEEQSVYRSLRCITEADIVIHMVDLTKGIGHQDRRLVDIALEKGKSVIIVLNKIDLRPDLQQDQKAQKEFLEDLRAHYPWLDFVDLIPLSAQKGSSISRLKKILKKTVLVRHLNLPTSSVNRVLEEMFDRHPVIAQKSGGKRLKLKYASMVKSAPPTFLLFTNKSKGIPENYRRYLRNGLRREFRLDNTPVHLIFRSGADLEERAKSKRQRG